MSDPSDTAASPPPAKPTGPLTNPAGAKHDAASEIVIEPIAESVPDRNFFLRLAETGISSSP